jgi:hypothetical protein
MGHGIQSLSTLRAALLSRESVLHLMDHFPRVARALWWSTFVEESIARAWLVNVGHRPAFDRMAHFLRRLAGFDPGYLHLDQIRPTGTSSDQRFVKVPVSHLQSDHAFVPRWAFLEQVHEHA